MRLTRFPLTKGSGVRPGYGRLVAQRFGDGDSPRPASLLENGFTEPVTLSSTVALVRSVALRKSERHDVFLGAGAASITSGVKSAESCVWESYTRERPPDTGLRRSTTVTRSS
jgi:hypothetical protein